MEGEEKVWQKQEHSFFVHSFPFIHILLYFRSFCNIYYLFSDNLRSAGNANFRLSNAERRCAISLLGKELRVYILMTIRIRI